jgi:hypothetical protein
MAEYRKKNSNQKKKNCIDILTILENLNVNSDKMSSSNSGWGKQAKDME